MKAIAPNSSEQAYDFIRRRILEGTFSPGERLTETMLARRIGVSRTPVRDALRRLNAEGMVEATANHGARVFAWSGDEMNEVTALRAVLESFGAGLAARKIDAGGLADLRRIQDRIERGADRAAGPDYAVLTEQNRLLHLRIAEISGNSRLTSVLQQLMSLPHIMRKYASFNEEQLQRSLSHHRELIAALADGDAEWASSIMRAHIYAARSLDQALAGTGAADDAGIALPGP
ncbi:MAG: GntR family transcriptional regulator [Inquilinaceae bacterium]